MKVLKVKKVKKADGVEEQIEKLKGKISFIKEVAIKNVEGIKKILAGARPDYEYASEEAGRIAEALARIPRIEAEIKSLEAKL